MHNKVTKNIAPLDKGPIYRVAHYDMMLQWACESVYKRVTVSQKTIHLYAVLHDCNPSDDKNIQNQNVNIK